MSTGIRLLMPAYSLEVVFSPIISFTQPREDIQYTTLTHSLNGTAQVRTPLFRRKVWNFRGAIAETDWEKVDSMYQSQQEIKPTPILEIDDYTVLFKDASLTRRRALANLAEPETYVAPFTQYHAKFNGIFTAQPTKEIPQGPGSVNLLYVAIALLETEPTSA